MYILYIRVKLLGMIVRDNILLQGVSGKIKNLVVKQYPGKTVITSVPDMSERVLTEKQLEYQNQMRLAISAAKNIIADPRLKERACEVLQVPPNKVFRKIVQQFILNDGNLPMMDESPQQIQEKQTLDTLKTIITTEIPDAEILLFGNRAKGVYDPHSDWDFLILTSNQYPKTLKWELQEKLFEVTIKQHARTNILLEEKSKWYTDQQYEPLRKKIEENFLKVTSN